MKELIYFLIVFSTLNVDELLSDARWVNLPGVPVTTSRKDDLFFININTGWVVTNQGQIYSTLNGGINWFQQTTPVSGSWLRCIGFIDSLTGFIGIFDSTFGNTALLKTTNGGTNWLKVTNLPEPKPKGLCGISVVKNTNVIYAVGRIEGPATVIKTTNAGINWINIDISSFATRLIDCYFISPDSGFVVGANGGPEYEQTNAVILFTSNGGSNWAYRENSARTNEQFWKISFSSTLNGVASLNIQEDSLFIYKTSDGGVNWIRMGYKLVSGTYFTQGIGFIDQNTGWIGGDFFNNYTYETTNGGITWDVNPFGFKVNRIRFINDTIGYAGGSGVYKYTSEENIGININNNELPLVFDLKQNFPNPFNPDTKIQYEVPVGSWVIIEVFNSIGQKIKVIYEGYESAGSYFTKWDGTNFEGSQVSSGLYFYKLTAGKVVVTRKMILVR
ncbi:MAG TPA: T9SS type A sorting domain-containing protein [Ignavibacteria bacterium]|nr:hypothetical protein [Bacteroidota bacterium]HRE09221.1 T9SS type A sorting domain-containing protein [Ignavibacteria bacterium]HRF66183.1 T9SS type A sorting domain-containing protein [Ignavibacteria bacterium]HRJ05669.1 T9SS type A sorting domain-containing protein [Ignavibacteria bacterium]HRJ86376.1 T9SS type A sorting domain-containing protein [Ignavibacteria bacterium]